MTGLVLVNTPQEAIHMVYDNAYVIKIKCLGCSESKFIPHIETKIENEKLIINNKYSFPIKLIEMITVRYKEKYGKIETTYKVENKYFKQFLNETAIQILEEFEK